MASSTESTTFQKTWFPTKINDIDKFSHQTLEYGAELSADHPGFTDETYRQRRKYIAQISQNYHQGDPIPRIEYTESEIDTWRQVYTRLVKLWETHACQQHNDMFELLQKHCGFSPDNIPQLEVVSNFLKERTGFRIRPTQGFLSPRDFLNGLAFKVFHATQYIRHHSRPLYTPEPDVCHELLGHAPLFANQDFADFSQQIGLISLGASEEDIKKLSNIYSFSVEFGICFENKELKVYGAGLLSSFGEIQYALKGDATSKPIIRKLEPKTMCNEIPSITSYQPVLYYADSFQEAKEQVMEFAKSLDRPFSLRYDPKTETVEVIETASN